MPDMGVSAILITSAAIMAAAGTAYTGVAAYQQGQAEQQNAYALARGEAAVAKERAARERDAGNRAAGEQAAMFGAAGFIGGEGTPASITADTLARVHLRSLDALVEGANKATSLRYGGNISAWKGGNALIGAGFKATGELTEGLAKAKNYGVGT